MTSELPLPFVLGETYIDRDGVYTVIELEGPTVLIERPTGQQSTADARVKARIHRNIVAERKAPPLSRLSRHAPAKRSGARFSLRDVLPVVAATIADLAPAAGGYVSHEEIVKGLVARQELDSLLHDLSASDPGSKSREWFASNFLQWFSHQITRGISDWQEQFEREQIEGSWAYRPSCRSIMQDTQDEP